MCDCYFPQCKICGLPLPVHLGDYATKRAEIEVFCYQHIPEENVKIFTMLGKTSQYIPELKVRYKPGWKMGIRYLTENAKEHEICNHPNVGADFKEQKK